MKQKRVVLKRIIALLACAVILSIILITCLSMQFAFVYADKIKCFRPDYEMLSEGEITGILNGWTSEEGLSDDDYDTLYAQTGLTKIGVDRIMKGYNAKRQILNIQKDYFAEQTVINDWFAPFICTDRLKSSAGVSYAPLENGDILVTSSTHLAGWRMGHAGLVTSACNNKVLQATAYGETSYNGNIYDFTTRVNFMLFSPKNKEAAEKAAAFADENLLDLHYDVTVGVLSQKNPKTITSTQCAHLVWYAYKQFGIDLDSDGGLVVTPKDIANCKELELVQVFGFDPQKLWK